MKKLVKTGILLMLIGIQSNLIAQINQAPSRKSSTANETQTYMGPLLNLVSTNFNYGNANSALSDYKKPVFGGQVGVSFQGGISPRFSILSEIYFIMKGGKLESNNPLNSAKTTVRLYSIEMPALARFHFGKVYVNAGPSVSFNFHGTRKQEGHSTETLAINSIDSFKQWEASLQAGAGYYFKVKQRNLSIDIRYAYGLTDIWNGDHEVYNRYLNISLNIFNPWKSNPLAKNRK